MTCLRWKTTRETSQLENTKNTRLMSWLRMSIQTRLLQKWTLLFPAPTNQARAITGRGVRSGIYALNNSQDFQSSGSRRV